MEPLKIQLDKDAQQLAIDWSDGFRCRYPWAYLRANCPSAGERIGRENTDPLSVLSKVPSNEIVDLRMAGNYALIFTWADGHNAGIYTWEFLRELAESEHVETTAIA